MNATHLLRIRSFSATLLTGGLLLAGLAAIPAYAQTASCNTLNNGYKGSGSTAYNSGNGVTDTQSYSAPTNTFYVGFSSADRTAAQAACRQTSLSLKTSGVCQDTEYTTTTQTWVDASYPLYSQCQATICGSGQSWGQSTYYFYPNPASTVAQSEVDTSKTTYGGEWDTSITSATIYYAGTCTYTPPSYAAPTVTLSANPTSITSGNSSQLKWSSSNASSCTGTNFSTNGATSGSVYVSPGSSSSYSVTCTGQGGSASASASVAVTAANTCVATQGQSCTSSGNSCSMTNSGTTQCNGSCSASVPSDSLCSASCVSNQGQLCYSSGANSCGVHGAGTITCGGSCNATKPSDSSCNIGDIVPVRLNEQYVKIVSSAGGTDYATSAAMGASKWLAFYYEAEGAAISPPQGSNIISTFYVSTTPDSGGLIATLTDYNTGHSMNNGGGQAVTSDGSYTFSSARTYYVRACANQPQYTTESNYSNDCTSWDPIVIAAPAPTASMKFTSNGSNSLTVSYGQTANLSYLCKNSSSATIAPTVNGSISSNPSQWHTVDTYALTKTTTFTLTCNGTSGGNDQTTVTANVTPPPSCTVSASQNPVPLGGNTTITWSSNASSCTGSSNPSLWSTNSCTSGSGTSVTPTATTTLSFQCTNSGGTTNGSLTLGVACGGDPVPDLKVNGTNGPLLAKAATTPTLSWTVSGATGANCSITSNGTGSNSYSYPVVYDGDSCTVPSGSHPANLVTTDTHQTVYTMTCGTHSDSVIVNTVPTLQEF